MAATEEDVMKSTWTVSIDTWGDASAIANDQLMELGPMIDEFGGEGAAAGAGGLSGGASATFDVTLVSWSMDLTHADVLREVTSNAVKIFDAACEKVGIAHRGIARVDVMDVGYAEFDFERDPETYLGVSELASQIGVSRQRVSELRTRADFPGPIAELAAGPVWAASSLKRFLATWERKPGRPLKVRNPQAERVRARRTRVNDTPA